MKVLITGDSHIAALRRGVDTAPKTYETISFVRLGSGKLVPTAFFEVDEADGVVRTVARGWPNITTSVQSLHRDDGIGLMVVSQALNTSRILRDYSWNTHVPWRMVQSDEETPLSDAVVDALIAQDSSNAVAYAVALKSVGIEVAVLEAPRVFARAKALQEKRRDVCLYIDALYRARVRDALAKGGVPVIDQPPESVTKDGLTDARFDHENPDDSHHGNTAYGVLALNSVLDYARALETT